MTDRRAEIRELLAAAGSGPLLRHEVDVVPELLAWCLEQIDTLEQGLCDMNEGALELERQLSLLADTCATENTHAVSCECVFIAGFPHCTGMCRAASEARLCAINARLRADNQRMRAALQTISDGDMLICEHRPDPFHCVSCDGPDPEHEKGCPVPGIEQLMREIGS
jgi:hypothetical protein